MFSSTTNVGVCEACPSGKKTGEDAFASVCQPILCGENEYANNGGCHTCPDNTLNAANDDASKGNTVCDPKAKCSTLNCGSDHVRDPSKLDTFCAGLTCELSIDLSECCIEKAKCSTLNCGSDSVLKPSPESIHCAGSSCDIYQWTKQSVVMRKRRAIL